ncbi:uncharacterized protein PRCAT00002058001 [Priceomyces carsonii]|uniref:uncharacterized protein n=1 Tax=Priceomyces carsonii TaxID=28549 RepID=UPI002EDB1FE8|nr:unnamed protein product [Priceomyces carsonii]
MNFSAIWFFTFFFFYNGIYATKHILSTSLLTCMENSQFTASQFDVIFYPGNSSVTYDISAISNINAKVSADIQLIAYGINAITKKFDFCSMNYQPVCPLTTGHLDLSSDYKLEKSITKQIPSIAYTIPDLDARVRVVIYDDDGTQLACVEAVLSNGKTVQTKYASWPIAAISGLGLITSGIVSVIGHSNTAAHIASNSMSLFIYFQSLAITSMMAVAFVPPIAAAWAQNFQWSLGIVKVGFVQNIANWYVQSTGGTATDVLKSEYLSISVQKKMKRSMEFLNTIENLYQRQKRNAHLTLFKRASIDLDSDDFGYSDKLDLKIYTTNEKNSDLSSKILVLRGMQRVAYLAGIEITTLFMTSIIFLLFFAFVMVVCLTLFKALVEILIRSNVMNEGKFNEYRQQWPQIIKGALYRLMMVAFPQLTVMCVWELCSRDSTGTVVVAVFLLVISIVLLCQAAIRVVLIGRRSVRQFKNPAYLLFGDSTFLNKFGFIYVQFRADRYFFICFSIFYIFLKSLFVAVLQDHGKVQSVIVFAIELIFCVIVCWIRPFMDKRTNAFNITISIINTINALFFMFFSYVFKQPHIVGSVMAIVYFILNAVFALFLLLFTIITCVLALIYKNPDTRYQPMKDDRVSFLPRFDNPKKGPNDPDGAEEMELMALGATAMRGHENGGKPPVIYDDDSSFYDADSATNNTKDDELRFGSSSRRSPTENSYSGNDSKRDSLYMENFEPTQPTSTIVGNQNTTNTAYNSSAYNNASFRGQNGQRQQSGNRVNFI